MSQWTDQSSNAYVFSQSNALLQPSYVGSSIGGAPGINFINAGSRGVLAGLPNVKLLGDGTAPFTIWAVVQPVVGSNFPVVLTFFGGGAGNDPQLTFAGPTQAPYANLTFAAKLTGAFGGVRNSTTFSYFSAPTPYIATVTYTGGGPGTPNYAFFASNVSAPLVVSGDDSNSIPSGMNILGANDVAGNDPIGIISELAIYDRVLTSPELLQLQTYGNTKYGL